MRICKILTVVICFMAAATSKAAAPTWSVNSSSFQFSMTVTSVANVNCIELANPSNKVAAFVGTTCRGVSSTSTIINGKYIAYVVVYSNVNSGETVTFKIYDAVTDIVHDAKGSIVFQDNAAFGVTTSPYTLRNNNLPTALNISNSSINEGVVVNTTIGTFSSVDPDSPETFTYTLVPGIGSNDNAVFNSSGNTLRSSQVFNYSTKSNYTIRVRTTDSKGCFLEQTFNINIIDVNTPPIGITISDSSISENAGIPSVIGLLSANDNDSGDVMTYSLVSGFGSTNNSSFSISGNTLRATTSFNYEVKNTYTIRVRVSDAVNNIYERAITIIVDDVNDDPTNILIDGNAVGKSFAENKPLGAVIATLSTTDEDLSNAFTYSFVNTAGNNNSDFSIIGNQLRTNALFDYETRQNYVVFIQTNDGNGGTFTKQLLLTVTDSNDAPTNINMTNGQVYENTPAGYFIAKISATDPDVSGTFTYTLVSGAGSSGNASFKISNDTLYSNAIFDYETLNSYSIRIQVSDGNGGILQQTKTITILDANDTPTNINLTQNQLEENLPINTAVGSFTTIDQDVTNTFTYNLVSGVGSTDNGSFNISGNVLRSSSSFDYETKSSYSIRVRTSDNVGAFYEKVFTISIINVVDAPTNITLNNDSINENTPVNTLVGVLGSVNQDTNVTYTYTFDNTVLGNDNANFIISGNQLRSNAVFDYETKNTYTLYITTTSGATSFTKLIQVFIRNRNDAPTNLFLSNTTLSENNAIKTYIGNLTTADPDNNPSYSYSLVSGIGSTHNVMFMVSQDSLYSNSIFDYENQSSYTIRIQTSDNQGGIFQKIFIVNITNSNDAPTNITLSESTINENLPANTNIGSFSTTDQDTGNSYFYTLVSGTGSTDNGYFVISGNTLRATSQFNYEQKNSYNIRVRSTDNLGLWYEKQFVIAVINTNDAPTNITLSNDSISENRPSNTVIGTLSTTDEDLGNTFVYSFANLVGNNNNLFTLTGNQLRTNSVLNYEQQSVYFVYVQSNDGNGGVYVKQFQINVKDSNDAPTNITLSNASITENKPVGSYVGTLISTDPDESNTFSYSLVTGLGSTNNSSFFIRNDSLFSATTLNYELTANLSIRVSTTDNSMASYQKVFSISVIDSNDLPTDVNLNITTVNENLPIGTLVGTLSTIDTDAGQTFTYSLVSGLGSTNNSQFSIIGNQLLTNSIFNYEVKNSYTIRVQTNDGNGGTFADTFNISILNTNDAPTNILLSNNVITENRPAGSVIGLLSTIDEDANTFTYQLANIGTNDNSSFLINGNQLQLNGPLNYEVKQIYQVQIQTNDGNGGSFTKQFLINVTDSNDVPTDLTIDNNLIQENRPIGTFIGRFTTTDIDLGSGPFVYTFVGGVGSNHNSSFRISNDSLYTNTLLNYETQNTYYIRVRTTDNGLFIERQFTISITDGNDAPTALSINNTTIRENVVNRTRVGEFSTTDVDLTNTFSYSLVSGLGSTDNASFVILGNQLQTNSSFNYEQKNKYFIRVRSTDNGGLWVEDTFSINIADSNDAPTQISLSGTTIKENKPFASLVANISTTDEDLDFFTYTLANIPGNDNSNFFITGNQLRSNVVFDFESKRIYNIYIQSSDGYASITRQFVINIIDSNDAPNNLILTNNTVNENNAQQTFIGTFYSNDADLADAFTYTLVSGTGSVNNSMFRISNDSLYSVSAFNFETKVDYSIRVRTTDVGGLWFEKQFDVLVINANDTPTNINLTQNQLEENLPINTAVGSFTTIDQDVTNTFTYNLVSGVGSTDNGSFNISGNVLRSSSSFDYETKSSYSIRVRTSDNVGAFYEKVFTISIINVVDAPTNITLNNDSINENTPVNTLVGVLGSVNQDTNVTYTYTFDNTVLGNDNANFIISGNQLRSNAVFDYETKNTYTLYITTTSGATSFTKLIQVFIRNRNDAPTNLFLSNTTLSENNAIKTYIGNLTTADPDNNPSYSYSLVSGIGSTHNVMFMVSQDSLYSNSIFDYENQSSYTIRIQTSDNQGGIFQKIFIVNITNSNDAPTNITLSESTINENLPANTNIGSFSTTDQDTGNSYFYTLVSGTGSTDNGYFVISGNTLRATSQFNYEQKNSYNIRVRSTDNLGLWYEKQFVIAVINTNDAPTNITLSNDSISENRPSNTVIGTLSTTDEDLGNTFVYSFANLVGNNNNLFTLTGNQLRTNSVLNYEQQSVYFVYVQSNDGNGGVYVKQFQINVKDSNDAPTNITLSNASITENKPVGSYVGTLISTDPDESNTFSYSLVTGLGSTNNSSFFIRNDSLFSATTLNYELTANLSIRVSTTDNSMASYQKVFSISVIDSNDLPTDVNLNITTVNENLPIGTLVGTLSTIDTDAGQTFTYSLVSGLGSTNNSQFSIIGNQLLTNSIFNYEVKNSYTIRVQTNDGNGGTFADTFNISILNTNDAPTNILLSNNVITENRPAGSVIGLLSTIDEDANTFTYQLANIGTNDNSSFLINGNQLQLNGPLNYEVKQIYQVQIQTNDGNGGSFTKQFLINVTDSNDVPTDLTIDNNLIQENRPIGTFIGRFTTTDIDLGSGPFVYTFVGGVGSNHNSSFRISNDSLYTNTLLNYETQNTYYIRVRTTDNGLFIERQFTISITDGNDAPTALSINNTTIRENVVNRTRVGEFSTTDVDLTNTFSYSLVSGLGSTDNASFVILGNQLQTNSSFNYEQKNKYFIRVRSTDNGGLWVEDTFSINIADSNDAPTQISLSGTTIKENKPFASLVANISTTDEDLDFFTYTLANIPGNDNSNFFITGNQLRSNVVFDFESKRIYNIYIQSSDGYASITRQFVINIIDSNDAPNNLILTNNTVNENNAQQTFIGTFYSNDADLADAFTYTLVSGTGSVNNSMFRISNDSLYSVSAFNFETKVDYSIRVRTTDVGGLWFEKQFDVLVINANDAPTDISISNNEIKENTPIRTFVANLFTTDEDVNTFTYTLVNGAGSTNNNSFVIQGNQLLSNAIFNYEALNQYSVRIQTNDGRGGTYEKAFLINILDSNDAPTAITLSNNLITENLPIGSYVGSLSSTDQDLGSQFTYSFDNVSTNNNDQFFIFGNEIRTASIFDYELKKLFIVYVRTTDVAGAYYTRQFIINVRDTNDLPTELLLNNNSVSENMPALTYVGKLSTIDADQFGNFTYSLVSGDGSTNNNDFVISNDSLLTNNVFNYENKKVYNIRLRSTDVSGGKIDRLFNINITDANDAPTQLRISNNKLFENDSVQKQIGVFTVTDEDGSDQHNYTFVAGAGDQDNALFIIDGNSLFSNFIADYEVKKVYNVRIKVEDKNGETIEATFVVNINDTKEKPSIDNQTFVIKENEPAGSFIGAVTSSSPDVSANLKYSIISATDLFEIDENSGTLTSTVAFDYETINKYKIKVLVRDNQSVVSVLSDTAEITINIADEIELNKPLPVNNFISPDGDGINDFFEIENVSLYADYSLKIFNDIGIELFSVKGNYQNDWNGMVDGNRVSNGVYYYIFYNQTTGKEFKGTINVFVK